MRETLLTSTTKEITGAEPASQRRSQPRGLRSAKKLLDAAASLFVAKGVEETTVDEIVLLAGTAKGTFYHHYESKAALLVALRESVIDTFQAHIDEAMAACNPDDLPRRLEAWVKAAAEGYVAMGPLHDVVFGPESPRWTASDRAFMRDLTALIRRGHTQGVWRSPNAHVSATFLFRGVLGVIDDLILAGKEPLSAQRACVALAHHLVGFERGSA
ncbi:TetR family transcriptional regulator [Trinickia dabaoshanensis]|uniref:TetR family transcriptional regulator n=1 Tax=Trinickia dabaoshanensis TaxID=564714 RepID=A0A2N7VWW2_9BURK|nr:TetR/AcrR family transcriptional regulator [Trinickia dabaoshanensis]PMS21631.1 TetR family transcriptional regulator [Trinickia dabaoshanensis]